MAVSPSASRRLTERRFFALAAALFPLLILLGFGRTYYLKGFFESPPVPSRLVHVHGLLMAGWVGLFITQVWLIASHRVRLHQRLGFAGLALAVVMIPVGLLTAINAARFGSAANPQGIPPLVFMVVPMADMVVFALLFGAAVWYRKSAAEHKRLILLTMLNFLPPAIARWPVALVAAAGPLAFFGIPDVVALACLVIDARRNGKVNGVFLAGTLLLVASHPLRLMLGFTEPWMRFATWVTS